MTAPTRPARRSEPPRRPTALAQPGVHTCPGWQCTQVVSPGLVACRPCWLTVPKPLRNQLVPAFLARTTDPAGYAAAVARTTDLVLLHTYRRTRR